MALRLSEGIDLSAYRSRWGTGPDARTIARLDDAGLVSLRDNRLRATARGRLVLNSIITELAA
jgi:oxygen-independent coproporphyrinogen-3 oxidase